MRLELQNIGILKSANVSLDGLTVIAGENDTGKSTVGKVLFSVIKGINNHDREFKHEKYTSIRRSLDHIFFKVRREIQSTETIIESETSHLNYNNHLVREEMSNLISYNDTARFRNFLEYYEQKILSVYFNGNEENKIFRLIKNDFFNIHQLLNMLDKPFDFVVDSINSSLRAEFSGEINSKNSDEKGIIIYEENNELFLRCEIKNDRIVLAEWDSTELEIQDATLIESPLIFHMYKWISSIGIFSERNSNNFTSFHIKDLIKKMSNSSYYIKNNFDVENPLLSKLNSIVLGESLFDREKDDFYFKRSIDNKYYSFATSNVASGIKSFGIIEMLLKADVLNERSLIIIDEPEIHLHPKWQVKYCEIIISLVKLGVRVVINTHSPYILQALIVLSENNDLESRTNFYLAEEVKSSHLKELTLVNDDLNRVFKKLSDPIQDLVWE